MVPHLANGQLGMNIIHRKRLTTTTDCPGDGCIDQTGEEADTTLKESIGDVHDAGRELNNTDLRTLLHFAHGAQETISRQQGIRIDNHNVLPDTNVA